MPSQNKRWGRTGCRCLFLWCGWVERGRRRRRRGGGARGLSAPPHRPAPRRLRWRLHLPLLLCSTELKQRCGLSSLGNAPPRPSSLSSLCRPQGSRFFLAPPHRPAPLRLRATGTDPTGSRALCRRPRHPCATTPSHSHLAPSPAPPPDSPAISSLHPILPPTQSPTAAVTRPGLEPTVA